MDILLLQSVRSLSNYKLAIVNHINFFPFLVGDDTAPYPDGMELWDTIDNTMVKVGLPPGFSDLTTFYRPVMLNFDENSFLLLASRIDNGDQTNLDEIFQYNIESGGYK